ncbi:MAG TPA: malto-oligosyltrehalose trehalohydrolase [Casimicrobiaceae bacterium]|nr:malto-oligosyltrehalose trehalohydrolase [Casimicrobiaceae bacterium]
MPFGATTSAQGVRFRLWAPAARAVDVGVGDEASTVRWIPLRPQHAGWFETARAQVRSGDRYRFRIDGRTLVPDPASRYNPGDVHGPSEVVDPGAFQWDDDDWHGRPWHEAVIYELHVGTFTPMGTFEAAIERLDYLVDLGVTCIELMPVADFPGRRNWGYDGALLFAPDATYGHPDRLKALVAAAHRRGLMVLLDVVYNHFGPEGNYLHLYAPQFFTQRHHTPWGAAINFDGPDATEVRAFFVHNALYWLEEFHLDGLRFDAVHAIADDSTPDILTEIATSIRDGPGRERHIHLVLENDRNHAHRLDRREDGSPRHYTAQWNDDFHHVAHHVLTGERDGYYGDYVDAPLQYLGRCLTEGFAYQGEASAWRDGTARGERSDHLPLTAFVDFLQNHDQVGNRAFGERLHMLASPEALQAAATILLLSPSPPMLFMGEEFATDSPFLFFCDFEPTLGAAVVRGRREEFKRFARFADAEAAARIPDPTAESTFVRSKLDWNCLDRPSHAQRLDYYRRLLAIRHREIVPRIAGIALDRRTWRALGARGLHVHWPLVDGAALVMSANLGDRESIEVPAHGHGRIIFATGDLRSAPARLPPWSVLFSTTSG